MKRSWNLHNAHARDGERALVRQQTGYYKSSLLTGAGLSDRLDLKYFHFEGQRLTSQRMVEIHGDLAVVVTFDDAR